jgi:hypothetical protein
LKGTAFLDFLVALGVLMVAVCFTEPEERVDLVDLDMIVDDSGGRWLMIVDGRQESKDECIVCCFATPQGKKIVDACGPKEHE